MKAVRSLAGILVLLGITCFQTAAAAAADAEADFRQAYAAYQAHADAGRFVLAAPEAQRALEIGTSLFADEPEKVAILNYNYGATLLAAELQDDAEPVLKAALGRYEDLYGKASPELIPVLVQIGHARLKYADAWRGAPYYKRALRIAEKTYGQDSREYGVLSRDIGARILGDVRSHDAETYLERGYQILAKTLGAGDPDAALAAFHLAKYRMATHRYDKAEPLLLEALASYADPDRPSNEMELTTHAFLVTVYQEREKPELATQHCEAIGRMTPVTDTQNYFPLFKKLPKYPLAAQRASLSGFVIVRFTVDEEGIVRDPEVVKTEGSEIFNDAAIEAASKFRYAPRFVAGRPVATPGVLHRITFEMAD